MPLVAHPVRSLWGSQPRCARCVCEWLHHKWGGASLPYPGGEGGTSILISIVFFFFFFFFFSYPFTYPLAGRLSLAVSCWGSSPGHHLSYVFPTGHPGRRHRHRHLSFSLQPLIAAFSHFLFRSSHLWCSSSSSWVFSGLVTSFIWCSSRRWTCNCSTKTKSLVQIQHFPVCFLLLWLPLRQWC